MAVDILMRGTLEPIRIAEDFMEVATSLNMASAQGKEFVVATDSLDGGNILIAMRNILTLKETDEI